MPTSARSALHHSVQERADVLEELAFLVCQARSVDNASARCVCRNSVCSARKGRDHNHPPTLLLSKEVLRGLAGTVYAPLRGALADLERVL
jgi:hypothetical protein